MGTLQIKKKQKTYDCRRLDCNETWGMFCVSEYYFVY